MLDTIITEAKTLAVNAWRVAAPAAVAAGAAALTRFVPDLGSELAEGRWVAALADVREVGAATVVAVVHAVKSYVHTETAS